MRVCHVIHSLQPGGAEDLLGELAQVAPAAGLELSVLSLVPVAGSPLAERITAAGVPVRSLDLATRWDPRALPLGLRAIGDLQPDVVHTHLKHADLVGGHAARRLRVPHISTLHVIEEATGAVGRFKRRLAAQSRLRSAACTIAVSDAQREWYLRTFPRADPARVRTVHNGVPDAGAPDPATRAALRAELGVPDGHAMVLMAGVMRPGKGHDQLLDALPLLPAGLAATFVLAGDGPLRGHLEERLRTQAPAVPVVLAGWRTDVPALLGACDLVVHPTLADALPTVLVHALAAGRPIVATRVGGVPEIVVEGTGTLVRPGEPQALATALLELLRDPAARERAGQRARQRFEAEFDARLWVARLQATYAEAVRGLGARS